MISTNNEQPKAATPDDPRVIRAVEEYVTALEAGERPDRQVFLARHADIADALAGCLDGLEFIRAARHQLDNGIAAPRRNRHCAAWRLPHRPRSRPRRHGHCL